MKTPFRELLILILIAGTGMFNIASSQSLYKIEDANASVMKLTGTSTMHNWEMNSMAVEGVAQFVFNSESEPILTSLRSLSFALEVTDLKSDNKGLDKNAYKALKADQFNDIHYKLTSAAISENNGNYIVNTQGKLTIAGVSKEISMIVKCVVNKDLNVTCSGSYKLNMTDYDVKPPSFLMGAMKTGNTIALEFEVVYKKQKSI